ncbi:hypothetical protein EP073_07950 [Geovibrio thiophilus]|uniref:Lipoprotein n=1 Tax=Geovibrio thiophilus TaxID=139438 RepID=A0A3R5XX28_9BACT|nr:hypothetical protein [Geovibrio thiophilus]QAR33334.1 hypothetical protein EP073_07950 [Geovibrio thiophilus]
MRRLFISVFLTSVFLSGCSMTREFGDSFRKEYNNAKPEAKQQWKDTKEGAKELPSDAKDAAVKFKDGTADVYGGVKEDIKKID